MSGGEAVSIQTVFRNGLISLHLRRRLVQVVRSIIRGEGLRHAEVDLVFVDIPEIHRLNRFFRGKNRPADVLSFPKASGWKLGEVVVSPLFAQKMVVGAGSAADDLLLRWVVHGTYHLLGYDHETDPDFQEMRKREQRAVQKWEGNLWK